MDKIQACITHNNVHAGRFAYEATSRNDTRGSIESVIFGVDMAQASVLSCGDCISVNDNGRMNTYEIADMATDIAKTGVLIRADRKINGE